MCVLSLKNSFWKQDLRMWHRVACLGYRAQECWRTDIIPHTIVHFEIFFLDILKASRHTILCIVCRVLDWHQTWWGFIFHIDGLNSQVACQNSSKSWFLRLWPGALLDLLRVCLWYSCHLVVSNLTYAYASLSLNAFSLRMPRVLTSKVGVP